VGYISCDATMTAIAEYTSDNCIRRAWAFAAGRLPSCVGS
jgi:hypothetical protein